MTKLTYRTLRAGTVKTLDVQPIAHPFAPSAYYRDDKGRHLFISLGYLFTCSADWLSARHIGHSAKVED